MNQITKQTAKAITKQTAPVDASTINYLDQSISAATLRAYRSMWNSFTAWCDVQGLDACPALPETVAAYVSHLADAGRKPASIDVTRAAIRKAHETSGAAVDPTTSPLVSQVMKGIRRSKGVAPVQKAAMLTDDLKRMIKRMDADTLRVKRDKAVLLLGFCLGARRSELVALNAEDVQEVAEGLIINIRRSKTDQEAAGYLKGVARGENADTCPVTALQEYMDAVGITEGPLFRASDKAGRMPRMMNDRKTGLPVDNRLTPQSIALIVKERAGAARLGKAKYSGHSLRAGMVTQAAKNGASVADIMQQSGHKSVQTVTRYMRRGNILDKSNASRALGL
jgi:site-specific recombinase XerD